METFYGENTDIQEWVDLLIEKLFTVCLLGGSEADSEFYKGKEAAEKISSILQKLTSLPEDALKGGIQQLVEQRLPDPRVIDNFPQFYSLMEEMIQSGLPQVQISEPEVQIPCLMTSSEGESLKISLGQESEVTKNSILLYKPQLEESKEESNYVDNIAVNVFAPSFLKKEYLPRELEIYLRNLEKGSVEAEKTFINESPENGDNDVAEDDLLALTETTNVQLKYEYKDKPELKNIKEYEVNIVHEQENQNDFEHSYTVPVEGERLFRVLKEIYPEEQPLWNVKIDQVFLFAQINNLAFLIIEDNSNVSEGIVTELENKGLVIIVCNQDDLAYPRRLERFIRKKVRKTRSPKTSSSFLSQ